MTRQAQRLCGRSDEPKRAKANLQVEIVEVSEFALGAGDHLGFGV